jgi:hypothetical protein
MDFKWKRPTIVEFLPLEGYAGQEIVTRLRNLYGSAVYCGPSVFSWVSEIRRGNEELRNEGRPGRAYQHEINAVISPIRHEDPSASLLQKLCRLRPRGFARICRGQVTV